MVLTDRQRADLHASMHEYLLSRPGDAFQRAAAALNEADPDSCGGKTYQKGSTPLLEKKWTVIPRLQKKVLELERSAAQNAKIHAHRSNNNHEESGGGGNRRMLPRPPAVNTLQGHAGVITTIQVHPVFTVVVTGSEDGTIKVWDHESGDYIKTLKGHTSTVNSVSFTPTGSHLASSSSDLSIKLWDFSTYTCLRTLRGHDHTISCIRFLPMEPDAIVNNTNNALLSSPTSSSSGSEVIQVEVAKAAYLLSASRDATVKLWHMETGFCDHTFMDHSDWVRCLAVRQSDGKIWASSGNDQVICVYDGKELIAELRGHEHVVESIAFVTEEALKGGRETKHMETIRDYLVSGGRDRTVRLWKVSAVECLAVFTSHDNWVKSVLLHPSGNYIISAGDDRTIRVFDIKANRCLRTLESAHAHFITSLDMHHTLPILVSGGVDQVSRCWQLD